MVQLKYHLNCSSQIYSRRSWRVYEYAVGLLNHLKYARISWTSTPSRSANVWLFPMTPEFSISLHFPIHRCSRTSLRFLLSWRLRGVRASLDTPSGLGEDWFASIQRCNWVRRYPSFLRFMGQGVLLGSWCWVQGCDLRLEVLRILGILFRRQLHCEFRLGL